MKLISYPLLCTAALAAVSALAADNPGDKPAAAPKPEMRKEMQMRRIDRRPVEMESATFLGVETGPVSPTLVAQLSLPTGAGLVVEHVVPDSPAAGALQPHDILLRLDDQILVDQRQLSVLIRNHKEGDEVTLTYVRGGKQATARVKLVKHDVPKLSESIRRVLPFPGDGRFHAFVERGDREDVDRVLSLMQHAPNAPMRMQIERGGRGVRGVSVNTGKSNLVYSDDKGSLELTINGEERTLVAKGPKGEAEFSGPVSTPEQRKALPPEVRERLEKLESMRDVTFRTDGDFQGAEMRVLRPGGEAIMYRRDEPERAPAAPRPVF